MYDWANSAYMTTTAAALLPAYFARGVVPEGGYELFGRTYDGQTLWGYLVGSVSFLIFLLTPILGAIADFSAAKKRFLAVFACGGAAFATLLCLVGTGEVVLTMILFLLTQVGFVCGNVFYDGFLPEISTPETIDRVSAKGYAFGYVGGGVQFALVLGLVAGHDYLGLSQTAAIRIGLATAGLWWLGFTFLSLSRLTETAQGRPLPAELRHLPQAVAYAKVGFSRTWSTARSLVHFKHLTLFLLAFMIYDDGVQTIIVMASVYASDTLKLDTAAIQVTFLIIQFVAFPGALLFGRLAGWVGARAAVLLALGLWSAVACGAYFLSRGAAWQFLLLGAVVGLVMGGTQALSRSLYGSMIPEEASAEFFGFYSVFSKFSAIWGPLIFSAVSDLTGSARFSILSLIAFFVAGAILLALVDLDEARASRHRWRLAGTSAGPK